MGVLETLRAVRAVLGKPDAGSQLSGLSVHMEGTDESLVPRTIHSVQWYGPKNRAKSSSEPAKPSAIEAEK